jgi:hypothetical protein
MTLAALTVSALLASGATHVGNVECKWQACTTRANVADQYYVMDTGEWKSFFGNCIVKVRFRHHHWESMETKLDSCVLVAKEKLVTSTAKRVTQ